MTAPATQPRTGFWHCRQGGGYGPQVALRPFLLGTNTFGGVGIPANIGLNEAQGDAVFFVDGDDWLIPEGFVACRAAFEAQRPDILIGNYSEYDEKAEARRKPADALRWPGLAAAQTPKARRQLALSLIAVPWRKFYRRAFLEQHHIRFPEGDHFFEDNPFHWDICLQAGTIAFLDRVLCMHRINRPGQTMASTGQELMAFFTHFETIRAKLAADATEEQVAALAWLINNMTWHIDRLDPAVHGPYALRAAEVLGRCDAALWASHIAPLFQGTAILAQADLLRRGDTGAVLTLWSLDRLRNSLAGFGSRLQALEDRVTLLAAEDGPRGQVIRQVAEGVLSLRRIAEFRALRALLEPGATDYPPQG